jgi:vacuolar-type H+-ATPase subunit F/Vma7
MSAKGDKTVVIGEDKVTLGFRLAGISEWYTAEGAEGARKLSELLGREDVGIIIASNSLRKAMDWKLQSRVEASSKPIVVFVPSKAGEEEGSEETSLQDLIRKSIGINLE